ncbi:NYN domain-containing protein [Massilia sp. BJB1822]|uniref:NYN domain-containing protein n=1 Tax=Massilia sp. BJB1822 TaxID=2744470 RepID=UPI001594CED1|nr:NYN domain-containing protein [Massilia sp. BJB1822]NVD99614.1 NYN domain-containing protein [Massilia sp. BJB1822]
MASPNDTVSMALFCDFENVALGVRDANYEKFDIKPVLERLLLKGSIVVKKAYCDWDRYKSFKGSMHEANFELIEIPHVRLSGKNSADIRMVVDALDLCYTKAHVNTFVIISGDSDFSPLVSKLRENAKKVIGVGVKDSTSDLLVANCDEFIFYDDLVRESRRAAKRDSRDTPQPKRTAEEEKRRREEMDKRRSQAVDIAYATFDALVAERGDSGKIWASVLKEAIKRRKPDFSESYYGFRTFGNLLEEMKARGLLEFGRDEKSGAYVYRGSGPAQAVVAESADGEAAQPQAAQQAPSQQDGDRNEQRRGRGNRGGRNRRGGEQHEAAQPNAEAEVIDADAQAPASVWPETPAPQREEAAPVVEAADHAPAEAPAGEAPAPEAEAKPAKAAAKRAPAARKTAAKKPARTSKAAKAAEQAAEGAAAVVAETQPEAVVTAVAVPVAEAAGQDAASDAAADDKQSAAAKRVPKPGTHKAPARSRLPRKPKPKAEA